MAILELKDIAENIDEQRRATTIKSSSFKKVCNYFPVSIPCIKQKSDKTLILTTREIDLFRSEREATYLAQKLRHQITKKTYPKHR